jgi:hypothetical protein
MIYLILSVQIAVATPPALTRKCGDACELWDTMLNVAYRNRAKFDFKVPTLDYPTLNEKEAKIADEAMQYVSCQQKFFAAKPVSADSDAELDLRFQEASDLCARFKPAADKGFAELIHAHYPDRPSEQVAVEARAFRAGLVVDLVRHACEKVGKAARFKSYMDGVALSVLMQEHS